MRRVAKYRIFGRSQRAAQAIKHLAKPMLYPAIICFFPQERADPGACFAIVIRQNQDRQQNARWRGAEMDFMAVDIDSKLAKDRKFDGGFGTHRYSAQPA